MDGILDKGGGGVADGLTDRFWLLTAITVLGWGTDWLECVSRIIIIKLAIITELVLREEHMHWGKHQIVDKRIRI